MWSGFTESESGFTECQSGFTECKSGFTEKQYWFTEQTGFTEKSGLTEKSGFMFGFMILDLHLDLREIVCSDIWVNYGPKKKFIIYLKIIIIIIQII